MKKMHAVFAALCAFAVVVCTVPASAASHSSKKFRVVSPGDSVLVWVYFTDKGSPERVEAYVAGAYSNGDTTGLHIVSERSLRRRLKVRAVDSLLDFTDVPVSEHYRSAIEKQSLHVRHASRWLNAVSAWATPAQLKRIQQMPFVSRIDTLTALAKTQVQPSSDTSAVPMRSATASRKNEHALDYGESLKQLELINVPKVHDTGNHGEGVMIAMLDDGVRMLTHQAFDSMKIIAQHDFVDNDDSVTVAANDTVSGKHGVMTLSTIGGYTPGKLIGPAFGAQYVLARTEIVAAESPDDETPMEEDNWIAAAEWADSIGVDIISTSLGYLGYKEPYKTRTWQNMDGNTAAVTRVADMAVGKGILVVASAGNNGNWETDRSNAPIFRQISTELKLGSHGADVVLLQEILQILPDSIWQGGSANGYFESSTEAAVKRLQVLLELTPDGIVRSKTLAAINDFATRAGKVVRADHNTLGAPADGDSVLTVGAISFDGQRVYFSSIGPTTGPHPRIKPDVMAPGHGVLMADPRAEQLYQENSGTSFSCPLTAGVAALLLRAHPEVTPMQIIEALRRTASNADSPDNFNGWGTIDAYAAIRYLDAK